MGQASQGGKPNSVVGRKERGIVRCFCCDAEMKPARKVKLRAWREDRGDATGPASAAYTSFREEMTFRWDFVCLASDRCLDSPIGVGEVSGRLFNLAGAARADRAAVVDGAKYQAFQRRPAAAMGLAVEPAELERGGTG